MKNFNNEQIDRFSEAINFKGSILGYDQECCLRYGLDVIDLMFFGWLEKFMSNGKMKHKEFDGSIYYNLHLDAFFKSLPICHIGADAMKKRILAYIKKGLLEKKTIQTQSGKALFIRFLEPYWNLSFDTEKIRKEISIPVENSPGRDGNPLAERDGNPLAERDGNPLAERDGNPLALNNPPVQYPTVQDPPPRGKRDEETIRNKICELFATTRFSSLMPEKFLKEFITSSKIENLTGEKQIQEYLGWIYEFCKAKKPDNLIKYFYTVAQKPYNMAEFLRQKTEQERKATEAVKAQCIICPVCGTQHLRSSPCPDCGLENPYLDEEQILEKKQIRSLPPQKQKELEAEIESLYKPFQVKNGMYSIASKNGLSELAKLSAERKKIIAKYIRSSEIVSSSS